MLTNQLRGLMAEFGVVAAPGRGRLGGLLAILADAEDQRIPPLLAEALAANVQVLQVVEEQIAAVDKLILAWGRDDQTCRHLRSIPGFGPILASAMAAMVVEPRAFCSGRDFAASLGLVPRQMGTGGKTLLGPISKRGNGYLRRLLVNGAMSVLSSKRARQDPWLVKLLETKKRKVAAVALANKMARIAWAVMLRQENFRVQPTAA
jgi:transposase